jgi:hypothetical protein
VKSKPNYKNNLSTYVEAISDDFQSTFTVVDKNTLANMLGMPGDFQNLTKIIHNYIPNAEIIFTKTNQLEGDYDIYLIKSELSHDQ